MTDLLSDGITPQASDPLCLMMLAGLPSAITNMSDSVRACLSQNGEEQL